MTIGPRTGIPNTRWAILTGEYPPQPGGVSDYTRLVAEGLAAMGDEVVVYGPPQGLGPDSASPGVRVRWLPDRFGLRGLRWLDRELARDRPDRILIQYVPHAFGLKAMNLPFAAWIAVRARSVAPIWVMFHEVAFPFVRRPLRHNVLAIVNRVMVWAVAGAADRVLVSVPGWDDLLGKICTRARHGEWMPIPCNVATAADPELVAATRSKYAPDPAAPLVGHFGTFGRLITDLLEPAVVGLLRTDPRARILLIGRGSERYRSQVGAAHPILAGRVTGTGELSPAGVAAHLRACDILLQPYPDGVSSRRTSVMAGLANRVPVVTNLGALSEPLWAASTGATVVAGPDPAALTAAAVEVLALPSESRLALGARGAELYFSEFTLERTIARLRDPGPTHGRRPAGRSDR
jgi:glycosyltransferase involved in cell wall biosynthesis